MTSPDPRPEPALALVKARERVIGAALNVASPLTVTKADDWDELDKAAWSLGERKQEFILAVEKAREHLNLPADPVPAVAGSGAADEQAGGAQ